VERHPEEGADCHGVEETAPAKTEAEIIQMFREFYEGLFPKTCSYCGRVFATLREYMLTSQRLWPSLNYDMELANYRAPRPMGGLAMASCPCGNTLALSTKSMPLSEAHLIMEWIRAEMGRRGMGLNELLDHLRDGVRKQVLADPTEDAASGIKRAASEQPPDPVPASVRPGGGLPPCKP
jgi:hypothetical protein